MSSVREFFADPNCKLYRWVENQYVDSITTVDGLKARRFRESTDSRPCVYVCRTSDVNVLNDILTNQVATDGRSIEDFSLLEIDVHKLGIQAKDVLPDLRTDKTAPMSMRIMRSIPLVEGQGISVLPQKGSHAFYLNEIYDDLTGYNVALKHSKYDEEREWDLVRDIIWEEYE